MVSGRAVLGGLGQLLRFAVEEARSCVFAVGVFAMLAVTRLVPTPVPRYDLMLVGCLLVTGVLWLSGVETTREVAVVGLFHLVGLALELFKVHTGSWAYPAEAYTKLAGVPLYSGFMYAAVGSYICQAWRRLDLVLVDYRPIATSLAAAGSYANFFTHHWLPDLRLVGALGLLAATWRTTVCYRVGRVRYRMPLALSFVLIGGFLWLAENAATFFGAWQYPSQADGWRMVHVSKFGSWALLVSVSFVLVSSLKRLEGSQAAGAPAGTVVSVGASVPATADAPAQAAVSVGAGGPAVAGRLAPRPRPRPAATVTTPTQTGTVGVGAPSATPAAAAVIGAMPDSNPARPAPSRSTLVYQRTKATAVTATARYPVASRARPSS